MYSDVYEYDKWLVIHEPPADTTSAKLLMKYAGELSIAFRFSHYFETRVLKHMEYEGYSIDCEFIRREGLEKKLLSGKNIRPDTIMHWRPGGEYNLLCIEIKRFWTSPIADYPKLKELTNQKGKFKYKLGLSLQFKKESPELIWFRNGNRLQ